MRGKHVHQADIRYIELGHHDFARVYTVNIVAGRHIAGVRHEKIVPAQDGDAFTVPVKTDMRPVSVQMTVLAQLVANDLGRIRAPIPAAVPPGFTHLLQADDINIEVVDGLGDLTELRILVFFLVTVQVQREDFEPAAGHVTVPETSASL